MMLVSMAAGLMSRRHATLAYATWNPSDVGPDITLSGGNLIATSGATWRAVRATVGKSSGKFYFEATFTTVPHCIVGLANGSASLTNYLGQTADGWGYYSAGFKTHSGVTSYGGTATSGDIIGVAVDLDAGMLWFARNGTWLESGNPAAGTNPTWTGLSGTLYPAATPGSSGPGRITANFGASAFAYSAPSGFTPGWYQAS